MDLVYWNYMAEADGLDDIVTTRTAKLNAVVREIKENPKNSFTEGEVRWMLANHGIHNPVASDWHYLEAHI